MGLVTYIEKNVILKSCFPVSIDGIHCGWKPGTARKTKSYHSHEDVPVRQDYRKWWRKWVITHAWSQFWLVYIKYSANWNIFYVGDSDDELLDEEPELDTAMLNHTGGVNRIRVRVVTIPTLLFTLVQFAGVKKCFSVFNKVVVDWYILC